MKILPILSAMVILLLAPHPVQAEPPGDGCAYTPNYWAANPDLWPVEELEVGQVVRDKAELVALLGTRRNGPELGALLRETIAAKLNVANGASVDISPTITWADLILAFGKNNERRFRDLRGTAAINNVRKTLNEYNESGCGMTPGATPSLMTSLEDDASFGTLKAKYR